MDIRDRVFIVTGAASGLGAAVTEALVAEGAKVVIADINAPAEMAENTVFQKTDVTSAEDAQACVDAAVSTFGALHGLVNCAGIAPGEKINGRKGPHALETFARAININLVGTFNMLRLAAEAIAKNEPGEDEERGVIINTASIAAFDGQIGQAAYAASKGGVASLTLPAARELASSGIRVMTIAPGIFGTPMLAGLPQEVQDSLGASVPFPARLGNPAEYASLAKHIITNRMLNGEVIRVDGALRMAPK
ncbi:3-hydroxyacyl-CoA dehydrogenase [Actibacterium pelagium]|uniref:3-hydroxyacyl-CoA dehydrogenase n=1 Tax=Actibacterium pelagium TaxID=2029103 RepID=A0A917AJZ8_9RHOB|nr:3-hydroxyacyl-CoA dehydrogenase [Actibacterium pelagium]GGE56300.1 3-hydroxyacyl-CoA dehydrogenase [Actibacterium pelagium]